MTISSIVNRVSYIGSNTIGQTMSVSFKFYDASDLVIVEKVTATDVESAKTINVDYTVSGGAGSTGTVTTLVAVPTSRTWTIVRAVPPVQLTDYIENDGFPAENHETALDKGALVDQWLQDQITRSLKYPKSESNLISAELPNKTDRANKYLAFGATGEPVATDLTSGDAVVSAFGQTLIDDTSASAARFTLGITQGTGGTRPAAGNAGHRFIASDSGQYFFDTGSEWIEIGSRYPNLIVNSGMLVNQRVGPFTTTGSLNNDDVFTLDHILLLSDGNNIVDVAQASGGPTGFANHLTATVVTGSKKFGFLFPIERANLHGLANGATTASLSFYAKTDTLDIENVRAHVLQWAGTADSITSDVVGAWGAEGSNPTPAADWAAQNTAANLTLTNSWARYKVENISVNVAGGVVNNLALFIHVDDIDLVAGDVLYLTGVMLNQGPLAGDYQHRDFGTELARCQRYYCKSFPYATAPAQNVSSVGALTYLYQQPTADAITASGVYVNFPAPMFRAPTVTYYSTSAATSAWWNATATAQASGASSTLNVGASGFFARNAGADNDDTSDQIQIQYTADGEM